MSSVCSTANAVGMQKLVGDAGRAKWWELSLEISPRVTSNMPSKVYLEIPPASPLGILSKVTLRKPQNFPKETF